MESVINERAVVTAARKRGPPDRPQILGTPGAFARATDAILDLLPGDVRDAVEPIARAATS